MKLNTNYKKQLKTFSDDKKKKKKKVIIQRIKLIFYIGLLTTVRKKSTISNKLWTR